MGSVYSYSALAVLALLVGSKLYDVVCNPLRKIPGPWYAAWTDLVLTYHITKGRKHIYIDGLHQRYGPVVRISPNQADISDVAASQQINSVRDPFLKAPWYSETAWGVLNVFNNSDPVIHRRQRRLLSSPISESGLKPMTCLVDAKVKLTMQRMREDLDARGVTDIMKWAVFMGMDVIAELTFGHSFEMLETGKKHQYLVDSDRAGPVLALRGLFPVVRKMIDIGVPVPAFNRTRAVIRQTWASAEDRLMGYERMQEEKGAAAKPTLFSKLHAAGEADLTGPEKVSNAMLYIVAGSDTISITLVYLIWLVCGHETVRQRLLAELGTVRQPFEYDDLRELPYLDAVINESLRLYPPIPSTLPRSVPPAGASLAGYHFPGGAVVSTQAWTFHRDAHVFPDPTRFDPDRWLRPTAAMKDSFLPFGAGSRICLGISLALMELRLATARFFLHFPHAKMSGRDGMCDADMEQLAFFLSFPKGKRCLIEAP